MKILLISPCKAPDVKKPRFLMIPQLSLHLIAGLTPPHHEVKIVEEEFDTINLDEECDLVGISCMTANAPRAYELAVEFRKRGRKVILGGVHPTILPDEALRHADSVVIGEAEGVWEGLLDDMLAGRLKRRYHKPYPSLDRYIPIRSRMHTKKRAFGVIPVMTTRGCPYHCDFCCVSDLYGKKIRHIPVKNVVRDIVDSGGKFFLFLDDNIAGDPVYARELFTAITPLGIKWGGQAAISIVRKTSILEMARKSGCTALFFGIESVSNEQLQRMRKSAKVLEEIEQAIKTVESIGIFFHASMIFGFDSDTKDIFPETLSFLERNRISSATLNVLTPYPGTKVYRQLQKERRLLTNDWRCYDHKTAVFMPEHMTPFELQAGRLWVLQEFTTLSSIMRRLPYHMDHLLYHLAMNIGHRRIYTKDANQFPELATSLFPLQNLDSKVAGSLPISALRFADLIPKRASIVGSLQSNGGSSC
jgi:radical SAM superfamily enzyme YgiQ (UPF0313 family)